MFFTTVIDPELVLAYRATDYHVEAPHPFILKIGCRSIEIAALFLAVGVTRAAFITACNPFSEALSEEANTLAQESLLAELDVRNLAYLPGAGVDASGSWPGEPSILVLGLPLEDSMVLGTKYKQNAIVWIGPDAVPQLILLR
jgi:hypothetical protein